MFSTRSFINNIELWLSAAALFVIWVVPAFLIPEADFWKVAALTAVAVGTLHGVIFWTIRRRQRILRERTIMEIREMLADVLKNQLSVVQLYATEIGNEEEHEFELGEIERTLASIASHVDSISEDAIDDWKDEYGYILERLDQYPQAA